MVFRKYYSKEEEVVFRLRVRSISIFLVVICSIITSSAQSISEHTKDYKQSIFLSGPELRSMYQPQNRYFHAVVLDSVTPQSNAFRIDNEINYYRLGIVSGTSLAFLGGFYLRMKTAWWNDASRKFHISYDDKYVKNIDKVGHLYGAILFTEGFGLGLEWAGLDEESSLLYGGILSTIVYTGIEIKDGFAPYWGFDPGDMAADLIGAFYPYLQTQVPFLKDFNFKWSYWPSGNPYFSHIDGVNQNDQFFTDDYEGQTFWLSMNIKNYLPQKLYWPDFLNISAGLSVRNIDGHGNGDYVVLISPDISLQKLFKSNSDFLNSLLGYLDYLHLPLPALEISPRFRGYGIYLNPGF